MFGSNHASLSLAVHTLCGMLPKEIVPKVISARLLSDGLGSSKNCVVSCF